MKKFKLNKEWKIDRKIFTPEEWWGELE